MPRIKSGQTIVAKTWQDTIIDRIRKGRVLPLISNSISDDLILGGHRKMVEAYANYVQYPLTTNNELPQITQFLSVTDENLTDMQALKENYVKFVKSRLFGLAEQAEVDEDILAEADQEFDDLTFAELSERLGYPDFDAEAMKPLMTLAALPLPIYLTTSYHSFIEIALKKQGKKPQTDICFWHTGLHQFAPDFDDNYEPSDKEPLVYHLHGFDEYPASLVLTEDDYLEFLVAISQDIGRKTNPIPGRVREAMALSSLLMLGYDLRNWDFRGLFWGLIKNRPDPQTSVSLQLKPSPEEENYLQKYLKIEKFEVYWGDIYKYAQELQKGLAA